MEFLKPYLMLGGIFIIIFVMIRLMGKNREIGRKYRTDVKSIEEKRVRLRMQTEANDFGQKLKWAVDTEDGKERRPSGGTKPPTRRGR
jgi:hypothetical protein